MSRPAEPSAPWWKGAVFYQIYPRSFQDSDGDGVGDLPGVIRRLDYVASLGVDALWLSPIFPSPGVDFGYDISDYLTIDPLFGTLDDLRELLTQAHARGLRVLLDLVFNHTSAEHPWFRSSRGARTGPHADWYLWVDGTPEAPPNNWLSWFGGSAWSWEPARGQYYLHLFDEAQPDLNWRNPEVVRAMLAVARSWLELGVDGFRLDVINFIIKDALLRDEPERRRDRSPIAYKNQLAVFRRDRPEALLLVEQLRALCDSFAERVLVGEVSSDQGVAQYLEYSKPGRLPLVFNFAFKNTPRYDVRAFYEGICRVEEAFGEMAWPCWVLGNHDTRRLATRFGDGTGSLDRARVLETMLLTLRGTPFLYYGDELGLGEVPLDRDQIVDPKGRNLWPHDQGRDGCRTPMPWDDGPNAGFSLGAPWLAPHPERHTLNVACAERDAGSLLCWHRKLLRLRRGSEALRLGDFCWLARDPDQVLAYERSQGAERKAVILNFTERLAKLDWARSRPRGPARVALGSHRSPGDALAGLLELAPYEILIADVGAEVASGRP